MLRAVAGWLGGWVAGDHVSPATKLPRYLATYLATLLLLAAACGRAPATASNPVIALATPEDGGTAYVEVTGLSASELDALGSADYTADQWSEVLRVAVAPDAPAMLGTYAVTGSALRFTPAFPFDPGRQYEVRFDPSRVPGTGEAAAPIVATLGRPASTAVPSTVVARVYPSGDVVPENLLRMYVEFSDPMGRRSGVEYMKVLNEAGQEIEGAILPLDYEFWSPDHKRFTIFFDPGRVKDGILPNREMGRPLTYGGSMTLVVSREWRDARGLPLKEDFQRTFRVTAADTEPLDTGSWGIQPPPAGSRAGVVVTFPEPLDHGLLMRALGVTRGRAPVEGGIAVDMAETRWTFTPASPWQAGGYELLALDILEDLAGNQIGRAFEVDNFDTVDKSPNPQTIRIPFMVR
ncbi:MAG: hypothetical protein HY657_09935 [Acidobacteria bacterium]|nr:hypothetical protein [Acidobacteriota bacterium]